VGEQVANGTECEPVLVEQFRPRDQEAWVDVVATHVGSCYTGAGIQCGDALLVPSGGYREGVDVEHGDVLGVDARHGDVQGDTVADVGAKIQHPHPPARWRTNSRDPSEEALSTTRISVPGGDIASTAASILSK